MRYFIFIGFIFCFLSIKVFAQKNMSVRAFAVSSQPFEKKNTHLYSNKLNDDGSLLLEPGIIVAFETFATPKSSLKFNFSLFSDVASQGAGFAQIMIRQQIFQHYKHFLHVGIGPALHFRADWSVLPEYGEEVFYQKSSDMQYKLSLLSGEIEYHYYLSKKTDFCISINNNAPESLTLAVGLKYWINRNPDGCQTCPSFGRKRH